CFNQEYSYSKKKSSASLTPKEWEDLMFQVQYLDHIHDPLSVLRWIAEFGQKHINILELLTKLKPDPRSAFVEYGVQLGFNSGQLLNLLKEHPEETAFFSALI